MHPNEFARNSGIINFIERDLSSVVISENDVRYRYRTRNIEFRRYEGNRVSLFKQKRKARRSSCDEPSVQVSRFRQNGDVNPCTHLVQNLDFDMHAVA